MSRWILAAGAVLALGGATGCGSSTPVVRPTALTPDESKGPLISSPDDEALLKRLCLQCHLFSEPGTLTKSDWDDAIARMASLPGYGKVISPKRFDVAAVKCWFRDRAPESLPLTDRTGVAQLAPPLRRVALQSPDPRKTSFVSQIKLLAPPFSQPRLLTCDMRNGWICEVTALDRQPQLRLLSDQVSNACRLESVVLSELGGIELVVANLGTFVAMDHNLGSVDLLRQHGDDVWEHRSLASNLGRVADVKPLDFDGDGDLDFAVAEFGWRTTGHVLLLENTTRKSDTPIEPQFKVRTIDERHGAVQLEIADIDGAGRLDVIALLAQEHEVLVAYLHQPDGSFMLRELFRAPHPVWGYSGFQLVDLDDDQDVDVLLTNGDMMDGPTLKPYHSITWLKNVGDLKFEPHTLAELPGAHRAEAADLDGDGDLDIVACTLVPTGTDQQAKRQQSSVPPALVWLEQTTPGQFEFHVWKHGPGRYPTLTTGDFDGDGKADVALGIGLWQKPSSTDADAGYLELWLSSPAP